MIDHSQCLPFCGHQADLEAFVQQREAKIAKLESDAAELRRVVREAKLQLRLIVSQRGYR